MISYDENAGKWKIGKGPAVYDSRADALATVQHVFRNRAPNQRKPADRRSRGAKPPEDKPETGRSDGARIVDVMTRFQFDPQTDKLRALGAWWRREVVEKTNGKRGRMKPSKDELTTRTRKCRSCKAPILWTLTAANTRRLPVDAKPTPRGNLHLEIDRDGDLISTVVDNRMGGAYYLAHFATCPHGKNWRGKKKPANKGGRNG